MVTIKSPKTQTILSLCEVEIIAAASVPATKAGIACNFLNNVCNDIAMGDGDCDADTQCAGDLKCGTDNCKGPTFSAGDDCCYDPDVATPSLSMPVVVYVTESPREVSIADGTYEIQNNTFADLWNGKPCYKKHGTQLWLCFDAHGLWSFQPRQFLGTDQGIMVSTQKGAATPVGAGPWRVWQDRQIGAVKEGWTNSKAVVQDVAPYPIAPLMSTDDLLTNQTIAGMLFGFMILGGLLSSLTSSTDPRIRACVFRLISATFTFLIAFLLVQAVWDLLVEQVFPAPFPRGFGLTFPIKPGIKIMASFTLFSICFLLLNVVGWKVQFRRSRLMVIKTIGAHVTAIAGITTFTMIQREVVMEAAIYMVGDMLAPEKARGVAAFVVVGLAWATFAVYRWAAMGLRQEAFRQSPTNPWGADTSVSYVQAAERSCMSAFSTQPAATAPVAGSAPAWGHIVNEAEDEATTVVVGFLAAQAILFCKTGQMPGFKGHYEHLVIACPAGTPPTTVCEENNIEFFVLIIFGLCALFAMILVIRSRNGDGGRPGKICQRSTAMAITWMIYRGCCWNTRKYFETNRPLFLSAGALVISIFCIAILVLLDKILDELLGGNASANMRTWTGRFTAAGDIPLQEKCMRAIMCCMGLAMALSWQLNMEEAISTVVQSQHFMANHMVYSQSFLSIVLALALIFPWRRIILPKSEMRERSHEEEIKNELNIMTSAENFMS